MDAQGLPIPLLVAAGGGGMAAYTRLGPRPLDTSLVHGKGFNSFLSRLGVSGHGNLKGAGKWMDEGRPLNDLARMKRGITRKVDWVGKEKEGRRSYATYQVDPTHRLLTFSSYSNIPSFYIG